MAVALGGDGGKTKLALTFPYFASSLYYDPTTSFEAASESEGDLMPISSTDSSTSTGGSGTGSGSGTTTTTTTTTARNAAAGASGAWRAVAAAAGGALLALMAM